jgi:hypothetical protein
MSNLQEDPWKYYGLVFFLPIGERQFQHFRRMYDPYYTILQEHMTFIFPVPQIIGRQRLEKHIGAVLSHYIPFEITTGDYHLTKDHWLMLTLKEGGKRVVEIHDALYSGILKPFLRADLPYLPRIGLGYFGEKPYDPLDSLGKTTLDKYKYSEAISDPGMKQLKFHFTIHHLTLVGISDNFSRIKNLKDIHLGREI